MQLAGNYPQLLPLHLEKCTGNVHKTWINLCVLSHLGQGNIQAKQVADAMLEAVIEVLSQNSPTTLQTIRIVIFQAPMLKDFCSSMQERDATDPKATSWLQSMQSIGNKIKGILCEKNNLMLGFIIVF